jgi:hypothetical protein
MSKIIVSTRDLRYFPTCPMRLGSGHNCARAWAVPFYAAGDQRLSYKCCADPSWAGRGRLWKP